MKAKNQSFKVGDDVEWESQSQGYRKRKTGVVIQVIPAGMRPCINEADGLSVPRLGFGGWRKSESYLVRVGNRAYWPHAKNLIRVEL